MRTEAPSYSLPRWRLTRWLTDAGPDVPEDIRRALVASLFGTLPIFAGGVLNSLLVSGLLALRLQTAPFILWFVSELLICGARLVVLLRAFARAKEGRDTPTDIYLGLGLLWSASVGYGAFMSLLSGDWVVSTIACMSAGAMIGGIGFRNFGAPRLAALMIALSLGPTVLAAPFSGEPILLLTLIQIPFYLVSMRLAAYKLNALMVATMLAERENDRLARHDPLTGLSNRAGLNREMEARGERRAALLYIDLDGFKSVNDGHGHAAGDELLKAAADRLRQLLRAGDVAARIGGDEFVIIALGVDRRQAPAFGERLIRELGAPYEIQRGLVVRVGVSVGVALAPDHGDDVSELLDTADDALYRAKTAGKSQCVVATAAVRWGARRHSAAEPRQNDATLG
ncbi:GGDEF domain-containing protein [Hansschlegelia sp.]|uniref:GGDEF domain-containing protein n=1 Tax=Hansschlegelia sp. TaxID=2041892 RepID=UPI002B6EFD2C|nr:GGDEF domain-containing protein [Hansschlegelia sp.]HVI27253.1 GGDEF domain-containing protein [Hansschlegelia sp.]